jgi:hypothetical protein
MQSDGIIVHDEPRTFELAVIDARRFETLGDVRDYLVSREAEAFEMVVGYALDTANLGLSSRDMRKLRQLCAYLVADLCTLGRIGARPAPSSYSVKIENVPLAVEPGEHTDLLLLGLTLGTAREMPHELMRALLHLLRERIGCDAFAS